MEEKRTQTHSIGLIKNNTSKCRIHGFGIQTNGEEAKFIQDAADLNKRHLLLLRVHMSLEERL